MYFIFIVLTFYEPTFGLKTKDDGLDTSQSVLLPLIHFSHCCLEICAEHIFFLLTGIDVQLVGLGWKNLLHKKKLNLYCLNLYCTNRSIRNSIEHLLNFVNIKTHQNTGVLFQCLTKFWRLYLFFYNSLFFIPQYRFSFYQNHKIFF